MALAVPDPCGPRKGSGVYRYLVALAESVDRRFRVWWDMGAGRGCQYALQQQVTPCRTPVDTKASVSVFLSSSRLLNRQLHHLLVLAVFSRCSQMPGSPSSYGIPVRSFISFTSLPIPPI